MDFDDLPDAWLDEFGELFRDLCDRIGARTSDRVTLLAQEIGYTIASFPVRELADNEREQILDNVRLMAQSTMNEYLKVKRGTLRMGDLQ